MFQNIKIFFVVFISLTNFTFSQGKVETLFPSPSPNVMNDISVVDNSTAWASTTFGGVLRTVDAGKTWETVKAGGDSWVSIITGVDKNTAWFSSRDSLLFSTLDGGKTWNKGVVGELKNIFSVNFIDGKNGFVSGYSNLLSKEDEAVYQIWGTKNGGNSWELINAKFDFDPTEIRFITTKFGIICGSGMMLRTEDGGKTWQKMDAFNDLNIYPQLSGFIDDKCGWVLTDMQDKASISSNCAVFKTIDGGKKWEKLSLPSSTIPKSVMRDGSIHFIDKMNGWVIRFYDSETGYASELLKTSNGGATWEISTLNSQHGVGKFKFFNKNIGIVLPQSTTHIPSVFRTINGGKSFEQITKGVDYNFTALHFIDEKTGFAGGREAIIKTTDGGVSWEKCKEAKGVEINFIKFYDSKKGIVLGNNETTGISVFHTDDGGKSWIRVSSVDDLLQFTKNEDIPPIAIKVVLKSDYSPIKSVFPKENLCFSILGDGSVLRSENDSGKYFEDVSTFGFDTYLSDIVFLNEKTGWVSGSTFLNDSTPIQINYFIKKTTDAGETWTEYSSSQKISNFQHLSFVDSLYGWCYSDLNDSLRCVWNTTDGGKTWSPNIVNAPNSLANFLGFQDRLNGWIVLSDPTPYMPWYIYRTKDGGKTWQPFTQTFSIFQLFFVNNNTFYGGGDINLIKATGID